LIRDPSKRLSCTDALNHEWFKTKLPPPIQLFKAKKIINLLRNFRSTAKLRDEALKVLVNFLTDKEMKKLRDTFHYLDKDKTGMISLHELQQTMKELGYSDTEKEIIKLMKSIHSKDEKEPVINYSEFIAATLDNKRFLTKEKLWTVFKYFDVDNTNCITSENLKEALSRAGRKASQSELEDMIREVDQYKDGKIWFDEFVCMMKMEDNFSPKNDVFENVNENIEVEKIRLTMNTQDSISEGKT